MLKSDIARHRLRGSCAKLAVAVVFWDPVVNDVTGSRVIRTVRICSNWLRLKPLVCLFISPTSRTPAAQAHSTTRLNVSCPISLASAQPTSSHRTCLARTRTSLACISADWFLWLFILSANRSIKLIINGLTHWGTGSVTYRWLSHWDTCLPTNRETQ